VYNDIVNEHLSVLLSAYNYCKFTTEVRAYILGLPRRKLYGVLQVVDSLLLRDKIPGRIAVLVRDLVRKLGDGKDNTSGQANKKRKYIKVCFHKGMDMVNLPSLSK
jgi:hypothetical protein